MREKGVVPDKKHYAMAMFACVTSNQCGLAESIFAMYVRYIVCCICNSLMEYI